MSIPFTQFLMPDGRQRPAHIHRPELIEEMARALIETGHVFEIEMLRTGQVSMEVCKGEKVLAWEICNNGLDVTQAVDRLTTTAYDEVFKRRARPVPRGT